MKKKGLLILLISLLVAALAVCGVCAGLLLSRNNAPSGHSHTYSKEWTYDAESHWHASTCGHPDAVSGKAAHEFGEDTVCDVCGYDRESGHAHRYTEQVIAPTCTEQGYTLYTCGCGDSYKDNYTPALGHDFGKREYDAEKHWLVCTHGCGERKEAEPHTFSQSGKVTAPTCTEQGYTTYTCDACGYAYKDDYTAALGHEWGDWEHGRDGHWHTCTRGCGEKEEFAHEFKGKETAPMCTEQGYTTYTCDTCGYAYKDDYTAALGHAWSDWTADGDQHWRSCTRGCGEREEGLHESETDAICDLCGVEITETPGLEYRTVTENRKESCWVSGTGAEKGYIVIPAEHNGLPVTNIDWDAFMGNSRVTGVYIPESVTDIRSSAFENCTNLVRADFAADSRLSQIWYDAFRGSGLKSIAIPGMVEKIHLDAFHDCAALERVDFGENSRLHTINNSGFRNCVSLREITIPASVKVIASSAFWGCKNLEYIAVDEGNTVYYSTENCVIEKSEKKLLIAGKTSKIPADGSVEIIGAYTFCERDVTEVRIPTGVKVLKPYSFGGCKNLTRVELPCTIEQIDGDAFLDCPITDFVIYGAGSATVIAGGAFAGLDWLPEYVVISPGVTGIGMSAFESSNIKNVSIPDTVTSIGGGAFMDCNGLTQITIPAGVKNIGMLAFAGCNNLERFTVAAGNTVYHSTGNNLIETASKTLVAGTKRSVIPADGSVTNIGIGAFYGLDMTQIAIPEAITTIGEGAFLETQIMNITLPASVTEIGRAAFPIGFESIAVAAGNPVYHCAGNCLIKTADKTLVACGRNFSIPADGSVTGIGEYAFSGFEWMTEIELPDTITSIGEGAFDHTGLEQIVLPEGLTEISDSAFDYCRALSNVVIPDSVTRIGYRAFYRTDSLKSVTIPGSVKEFGRHMFGNSGIELLILQEGITDLGKAYPFYRCESLKTVVLPKSLTNIGGQVFYGSDAIQEIYYCGTMEEWSNVTISGIENGSLAEAAVYYFSEEPPAAPGNYWHYDGTGTPVKW